MIPGQYCIEAGEIELNAGRRTHRLSVSNQGDRPIQVGSHYHFFETNDALMFERGGAFLDDGAAVQKAHPVSHFSGESLR